MKSRILILALAAFSFTAFKANAQIDVTVNPIGLLFGGINVGADFVMSDQFSIEGNVGYNARTTDLSFGIADDTEFKYTGVPIQAVGKYYFNPDDGADKFYGSVFLRYVNRSYKSQGSTNTNDFNQSRFGAGIGVGTKSVSRGGVVFDFGVNIGRVIADKTTFETDNGQESADVGGLIFGLKVGVGYRFGA